MALPTEASPAAASSSPIPRDSFHFFHDHGDGNDNEEERGLLANSKAFKKKVFEQEPKILPCSGVDLQAGAPSQGLAIFKV